MGCLSWHVATYATSGHLTSNFNDIKKTDTYFSAGVLLMTSMTYTPEVTSGKSDCFSFSSLARLSGDKEKDSGF